MHVRTIMLYLSLTVSVKHRYRLEVPRATDLYRVVLCVHYIMNNIYYAINVSMQGCTVCVCVLCGKCVQNV